MRSKILSAAAASGLIMAVPSVAMAQEDHSERTAAIGVTFGLTAMLILILIHSRNRNIPISP